LAISVFVAGRFGTAADLITLIMLAAMAFADNSVRVEQAAAYDPDVNP
jgi:hypothetical protein